MSVTDLTNTIWIINSETTTPSSTIWKSINFTSNSNSWTAITIYDDMDNEQVIAYRDSNVFPTIVYEWGWQAEAYRTINITGGSDVTDSTLIAWLEANAEQQIAPTPSVPDVSITYEGAEIATMSDTGTKTLKTGGKYMTDDVTIQYTRQGSSTVQSDWNETDTTSAAYILNKPDVAKIGGIAEGEIGKETTYNTNYINWEDSNGDVVNFSVDSTNAILSINTYDSAQDDWTQTGAIDLNNVYSTDNNPTVMELDGCQRKYLSSAGTTTLTLTSAKIYLLVITKLNNSTANNSGLYIVQCHTTSSVRAIVSSAVATVSISDTTLTVTTSSTNVDIECIRLTP